ncbi:MAG: hydantoinase B/oxoprolinase family protein [Planctomycetota bacterium]|nr:hydantoinase B/oxoprolinase family protein [Planctomycetota bacterium]
MTGAAELEVFRHLYASVAEEMGITLQRSALSANIRERRDYSCALFDAHGRLVAQAAHIPVQLGSMGRAVAAVREAVELLPGDAVLHNDPYSGGTHLPDVTLVSPIHLGRSRKPQFFAASRAHHSDIGGAHPGSMAPVDDVHAEGLRLPPVHLVRGGAVEGELLALLLANLRDARERRGDLLAQWAANRRAQTRIEELAAEHGVATLAARGSGLVAWTAARVAELIERLPRRALTFEDTLEPPQPGAGRVRIHVRIARVGRELVVDFSRSSPQLGSSLNATLAVTEAAVAYVLQLLLPPGTPINEGCRAGVRIVTRPGTVVDARYPAPVAAGNVETSQRLVDTLLGALAPAFPDRIPAASSGTMSNLSFGGLHAGSTFAYYETIAGGAGASPRGPGAHAVHTHMTNTRNTPIEEFERRFPVRVARCTVRRGSGGKGARAGGDGIEKRLEFLAPARVAWIADRTSAGPWGLAGGGRGAVGRAEHVRKAGRRALGARATLSVERGDALELFTPGGGAHGR